MTKATYVGRACLISMFHSFCFRHWKWEGRIVRSFVRSCLHYIRSVIFLAAPINVSCQKGTKFYQFVLARTAGKGWGKNEPLGGRFFSLPIHTYIMRMCKKASRMCVCVCARARRYVPSLKRSQPDWLADSDPDPDIASFAPTKSPRAQACSYLDIEGTHT